MFPGKAPRKSNLYKIAFSWSFSTDTLRANFFAILRKVVYQSIGSRCIHSYHPFTFPMAVTIRHVRKLYGFAMHFAISRVSGQVISSDRKVKS